MRYLLLFIVYIVAFNGFAQIITTNVAAEELAAAISGPGASVSNAELICPNGASGIVVLANAPYGIDSAVVLSSGYISSIFAPVDSVMKDTTCSTCYDADLHFLMAAVPRDACILSFDIIPGADTVMYQFVFASDEYQYNFNCLINDVVLVLIEGPGITGGFSNDSELITYLGNSISPVGVSYVHPGAPGCASMNGNYYIDHSVSPAPQVVFNGFTTVLEARSAVHADSTYRIHFKIGDASDNIYDSGVFIRSGSKANIGVSTFTSRTLDVNIYPNPAKDHIYSEIITDRSVTGMLQLKDILGRTLHQEEKHFNSGKNIYSLPSIDLSSGIYFLTVTLGEKAVTRKFIIQ